MSEHEGHVDVVIEPEAPPAAELVEPVGDAYREEMEALRGRLDGHEQRLGELHGQLGELHGRIETLAAPAAEPAAEVIEADPEPEHVDEPRAGRKFGRVRR